MSPVLLLLFFSCHGSQNQQMLSEATMMAKNRNLLARKTVVDTLNRIKCSGVRIDDGLTWKRQVEVVRTASVDMLN